VSVLLALGLAGGLLTGTSSAMLRQERAGAPQPADTGTRAAAKPNIVFILTDDLSKNLIPYMSSVRAMRQNGTTFDNYFVADSLCCPSRSSIFTGDYPHNTRVLVNEGNREDYPGGYEAFKKYENQKHTYAVELDAAGYRTGFLGKYLNGYKIRDHVVPRGWDEWHVASDGYTNVAGTYSITNVKRKGDGKHLSQPKAYMNDLLGERARQFADRANAAKQPFFLQISSFAPHSRVSEQDKDQPRFPPAERDRPGGDYAHGDCGTKPGGGRYDCADLKVRRTGAFDDATYDQLDNDLRNRVRMMQSLDDQIINLRKHLARNGQLDNTFFVFSADNGFHLGEHGMLRGKGTAYDHDSNPPLVVEGPGVRKGQVRDELVQNTDFYPTFQHMAGLDPKPSNGHGLMYLLHGGKPEQWRDGALMEHKPQLGKRKAGTTADADPDLDGDTARAGFLPALHPYNAIRTRAWLYVRYDDGSRPELYDLRKDPGQHRNVWRDHPQVVDNFDKWMTKYVDCGKQGKQSCWQLGQQA
jgi:arylsulfatase A-like enzyme